MGPSSTAILPAFLQPKQVSTLSRLGRDNDGGYLVDARNVAASQALISIGINDDWSFEEAFHALNPAPIWAYDGSVGRKVFQQQLVAALKQPFKPSRAIRRVKRLHSYNRFFAGERRHFEKFVGMDAPPGFISLRSIFADVRSAGYSRIFLKIDIEGWEYRILEELLANASLIEGLAIEFHDVDLHLKRIAEFVRELPLTLVHTHVNNFGMLDAAGVPFVIECSFTRQTTADEHVREIPHPLDMPNKADGPNYALHFV